MKRAILAFGPIFFLLLIAASPFGGSSPPSTGTGSAYAGGPFTVDGGTLTVLNGAGVTEFTADTSGNVAATTQVVAPTYTSPNSSTGIVIKGTFAAGAGGTDVTVNTSSTRAAGNIFGINNNGSSKVSVDFQGVVTAVGFTTNGNVSVGNASAAGYFQAGTSLPTCGSTKEGAMNVKAGSGGTPTKMCYCANFNGSGTYQWVSINLGTGAFLSAGGSTTVCP